MAQEGTGCVLGLEDEGEDTLSVLETAFIHSYSVEFWSTWSVLGTKDMTGRRYCPALKKVLVWE